MLEAVASLVERPPPGFETRSVWWCGPRGGYIGAVTCTGVRFRGVRMLHPLPDPHHHNSFVFRAGPEPGILVREAGALPRRLKATASTVSHQSISFWGQGSEVYTQQPLLAYIRYTEHPLLIQWCNATFLILNGLNQNCIFQVNYSNKVINCNTFMV